jgi:CBS domain-containing protein
MAYEPVGFLYLSEMLGAPVLSLKTNQKIGRIVDIAATSGQVYPKISGIVVGTSLRGKTTYISWNDVRRSDFHKKFLVDHDGQSNGGSKPADQEILLRSSFLDKQLISTSGNKLVRVNDLQLLLDNSQRDNSNLYLVHIDIGVKGLLRRLGYLRAANAAFKWIVSRDMKDKFISWKYVQPTTTTNVHGSLQLATDASKLSEVHPADLADILEDLGTDERIALLESIEPAAAASTMQEMPLKIRAQVAETLDTGKLAAIIQAMQRDESVDLMDAMATERRNAVLGVLPPETSAEIKELSKLSSFSVGSIMNTEYITIRREWTAGQVLDAVKGEARRAELFYYVYVVDDSDHLKGIVSLRSILTAQASTPVEELMRENVLSVAIDDQIRDVAQIFLKYNFEAIPVVDEHNLLLGIVTLRDTLESVFPRMRED